MANILVDNYSNQKEKKFFPSSDLEPVPETDATTVNQLGNFIAQKVAANQPAPIQPSPSIVAEEPAIAQTPVTPVTPSRNALANIYPRRVDSATAVPSTERDITPTVEPSEHEKYWGNKVFGKIPLDQFVQLSGMLAHSFNPEDPLGKMLAEMGAGAYKERIKREQEGPNMLLQRRLTAAKLASAERNNEAQIRLGEFIDAWPELETSLRNAGYSDTAIENERLTRLNNIFTPYFPTKGVPLQSKFFGEKENRVLKAADAERRIDEAIARGERFERTLDERRRHNIVMEQLADIRQKMAAQEKEGKVDKTLVQVEDEWGNMVWKPRSEAVGGVAKRRYTSQQLIKAENLLRNPEAVKASNVDDLTSVVDAFNAGATKPHAFRVAKKVRNVPGVNIDLPGTESYEVEEVKLPKGKNGQQITTSDVRDLAVKRGISFDQALTDVINFYGKAK